MSDPNTTAAQLEQQLNELIFRSQRVAANFAEEAMFLSRIEAAVAALQSGRLDLIQRVERILNPMIAMQQSGVEPSFDPFDDLPRVFNDHHQRMQ